MLLEKRGKDTVKEMLLGKRGEDKGDAGRKKEVKLRRYLQGKEVKRTEMLVGKKEVKRKETEKKPVICLILC